MDIEDNVDNNLVPEIEKSTPPPKRKNLPLVFSVLIVLLLGGGAYWYWINTPQYSLRCIEKAVKQNDLATFEKYVDLDTVCPRAVDQLIATNMGEEVNNEYSHMAKRSHRFDSYFYDDFECDSAV